MSNRSTTEKREAELDRIRSTYAGYQRAGGRHRLWDRSNRGYARLANESQQAIAKLVVASLPSGGQVLDLGCGTGELAETVRQLRPQVEWTGVDLIGEAVEQARQAHPWGRWVESAADELPFDVGLFDVAVASTLFSSLPSEALARAVAAEIARVLKPSGVLIWYDLRYGNPTNPAVHGLTNRKVMRLFPAWKFELRSITLLPPLARRLGFTTPALYPILSKVPPLRSHLIGRLHPPRPPYDSERRVRR